VTIVRAIHAGELAAVRLGKRGDYRIRPDALNDWITPAHDSTQETTP